MSILIRGMEMPQGNSTINVLIYADGTVYTGHVNDSRYSAVSVQTPHGRLVDADKLKRHIDKLPALPDGNFAGTHRNLKALINMQQPVIEAEGSEDEDNNV